MPRERFVSRKIDADTMSARLTSHKRLLTQHCNKLDTVLARFKGDQLETLTVSDEERAPGYERDCIKKLQEALGVIESCTSRIEQLWQGYADALDTIDNVSKSELEDFDSYVTRAEGALSAALDYTVILQGRVRAFTHTVGAANRRVRSPVGRPEATVVASARETPAADTVETRPIALPTLPIPTFTGNIWDWDNFWVLFNANVHSQPIPSLFKFNHLLNALKGEPHHAVKKFQVTEENYPKAIEFLQAKYGNKEELVNRLISRLETVAPRSPSIKDQRVLLEQLQVIVSQLRDKGEQVDSQWLLKQVLSKFTDRLQRRVLEKKYSMEGSFLMDNLLSTLDQLISSEEKIALFTSKNVASVPTYPMKEKPFKRQVSRGSDSCMYCSAEHKSGTCTKYRTPQERANYLREHKLCFICASPQHATAECKRRVCFVCQGKHHTSCCFKTATSPKIPTTQQPKSTPVGKARDKERPSRKPISTAAHQVNHDEVPVPTRENDQPNPVAQLYSSETNPRIPETFLPIGELTIMDPTTRRLRKVPALLDSGAECSFIDQKLADELRLPTLGNTTLRVRTFGSDCVQECNSRKVPLEIWDEEGEQCSLELLTHKSLTSTLKAPPILEEDIAFIRSNNLPVNLIQERAATKPLILLGCDQLWQLIRHDQTQVRLPSGLHLLPTRLGHLLTGQIQGTAQMTQILKEKDAYEEWDRSWSLQATVNTVSVEHSVTEEQSLWERYWKMEQEGAEEFVQPEHEVQAMIDKKVLEEFLDTVERKEDGYYVRLPWKEIPMALPDNRAIALKRLMSVWTSLQKDPNLLEMYNDIFKEQYRLNIIEDVQDENAAVEGRVHYLPHQAVLTPQKNTTKLRIVFDASAHFKNCPSLNDALHRGPVLLPKLYGLLLRFRIGRVALISDVEKAFLQVRLHTVDRDATRCLWLRDHKNPPTASNLRVYRFTRVTFGLLPSPFLLAATTYYHLDQYPDDVGLVKEIKENLYVDNLLVTLDTPEEGLRVYSKTKEIFKELKMNLREFASNNREVMETISQADRSTEEAPKVLGIRWKTKEDHLEISCNVAKQAKITKRTVASTIASIYDPMGWIVPLLHKAKLFLQSLWKEEFEWDTPLPPSHAEQWNAILQEIQGFQKSIPRFLTQKLAKARLVTCADASSDACAACTYLRSSTSVGLVMAKGKLPSLKAKMTIPKMELNALTLATRLSNSVASQIASVVAIEHILILTDSEIALNWIKAGPQHDAGPFIRNRVFEIHNIVGYLEDSGYSVQFGHIPSHENPADCATRGLDKSQLGNHFWWKGPSFISETVDTWENAFRPVVLQRPQENGYKSQDNEDDEEPQVATVFSQSKAACEDIFHEIKFADLRIVKRVVAYAVRFIRTLIRLVNGRRARPLKVSSLLEEESAMKTTYLSGREICQASKVLVKQHQLSRVSNTLLRSLHHLGLYTDEHGILRCQGRLGRSDLDEAAKFPMLILQKSWLSKMIIRECHGELHAGISHTMSRVRETYWIPKLRAEVTSIIRRCAACQRMNNLPYKYPEQGHLPTRRVTRSRPFEHVGLDYFGPLSVKSEGGIEKCYGSILTCLVTRLVHLDLVSDGSTLAFLHMMRRFFARRGVPKSITSDNAPTFALGEVILSEGLRRAKDDPAITKEMSDRQIDWIYNTPYAPWQGGVYERLIQSVKLAMHKFLGRTIPTREELATLIIEIEGMLNTRPLLYVESEVETNRVLRPIDFLQNEFEVPPPFEVEDDLVGDPEYVTPAELLSLQTKSQAVKAIQSSYKLTEHFWQLWQTQYLTSLREKHQREVVNKRGSRMVPKQGQIVLVSDALQPRYVWKMGRIEELVKNKEGVVREAVVALPSQRKIRRPLNLLVPLELDDDKPIHEGEDEFPSPLEHEYDTSREEGLTREELQDRQASRYNLRPRKKVDFSAFSTKAMTMLFVAVLSVLCGTCSGSKDRDRHGKSIRCVKGGVVLKATDSLPYEVCADDYCKHVDLPGISETVHFPAQVVLHEHEVQWKILDNTSLTTVEIVCPPAPFCEHIDCAFCSALVLNPECWPLGAIAVTAVLLYFFITGCYVFLYVPVVIGKPIRIVATAIRCMGHALGKMVWNRCKSRRRRRATDLVELLAIMSGLSLAISQAHACQQVNIFSHQSTSCTTTGGRQLCKVQMSQVLKINPFKREACFRMLKNSTTVHEIRVKWKSLDLTCEPETEYYTRDTEYHVVDSKRCPHTGSCIGRKCADINASALLPELEEGNSYPGTTYCVESCGGPGCDCFYWSSGCLFYRIYVKPTSTQIFEVFHCNRWKEAAKIEFWHWDGKRTKERKLIAHMVPNVPKKWGAFTFTLSTITVPPTPLLSTPFISDGNDTALWNSRMIPPMRCDNSEAAAALDCQIKEDCNCYPAETRANCKCKEVDIRKWFYDVQNRLPVVTPAVVFRRDLGSTSSIRATIPTMTTSEIILSVQDELETNVLIDDDICTISNVVLTGCYNCAKGAEAKINCKSSKNVQAEITCNDTSFTVRCDSQGVASILRFSFARARIGLTCSVSCGSVVTTFQLGGILKFTHSVQALITSWLDGHANDINEIQWPDIYHIADVFLQWYKTLILALGALVFALLVTYVFISTCGFQLLRCMFRMICRVIKECFRAPLWICRVCCKVKILLPVRLQKMHEKRL